MLGVRESSQTGLHADRYSPTYVRYYTRNILHRTRNNYTCYLHIGNPIHIYTYDNYKRV